MNVVIEVDTRPFERQSTKLHIDDRCTDYFTVDVISVADVLQVASRILPAQLRLGVVRIQPRMGISTDLRAGGHAARGRAPHLIPGRKNLTPEMI